MRDRTKVFMVRAGRDGEDEEYVLNHNLAMIGFREFPSLEGKKEYNEVYNLIQETNPDLKPRTIGNFAGQLGNFAIAMKEGDIVVLPRKLTSQVALGKVIGPYRYLKIDNEYRHTRAVKWIRPEIARTVFLQDLLYSFGSALTVCNISRNDAERRIEAVLNGKPDPGFLGETSNRLQGATFPIEEEESSSPNLADLAHDQIVSRIQSRFSGHALARLVEAVLKAEGWTTKFSPAGPDGGVDIFAGRGSLGLDQPRLCVQVKSQINPCDVTVYRTLQGSMQTFKAEQGLLVCWGGFNKAVQVESKQGYFSVRLWESRDLVEAIYRNYELLPAEIQAELPLKRVWMLVVDESDE
ncbi:restriction system protein [Methanolinea mesophila]|uniref:restriction endonuclease n=1 Tax=Methanolinea mesophila TaxID=547055 RepID=UPI001AE91F16|nr:restriction endonuclease [Methanolinea mesophila]MBP1928931.1 restriction system protein [Methanolinea mesophila]